MRTLEELYQLPFAGVSADSLGIKNIWLSKLAITYTFSGNGHWNNEGNWVNNLIPPTITGTGSNIMINNAAGGQCLLKIPYSITAVTKLPVMKGKKLVITGKPPIN